VPRPPGKITRPFQLFRDLASRNRRTQPDYAMRITLAYAERIRVLTLAGSTLPRPSTVRWGHSPVSTTSFLFDCRALAVLRGIRIHNEGTPPRSNPKRSETSSAWDASPSEEPIQASERSRSGTASGSAPSSAATSVPGPVREAACRELEDSSSCLPLRSALRAVLARKRRMAATCPHAPIVEAAQEG
jgi:hypothetical protein